MRIAHIVSTFPPRIGGMGVVCFQEAKRLAESGNQVTVFTMRYNEADEHSSLFRIKRLKPWIKKGDGGWVPQLLFNLRNFDILHLHYPFYVSAHCVLLAKLFWKKK